MTGSDQRRIGEVATDVTLSPDATVTFIGRLRTPWVTRAACPRQGDNVSGPICTVNVDPLWRSALHGIEHWPELQVLYWMDQAARNLVALVPRRLDGGCADPRGPFALRAPTRPNPIASAVVALLGLKDCELTVRGLDCVDGTPLLDLKPWRGVNR